VIQMDLLKACLTVIRWDSRTVGHSVMMRVDLRAGMMVSCVV
jgi:hypothetical protein